MGSTCSCQQHIDDDQYLEDPLVDDKTQNKQSEVEPHGENKDEQDQDQQKEQQTIDIDPIQLKSYEIEDNCPQGLQPLTVQAQQEFLDQFPPVVKKLLQKLPKLEIKANLSPNYKRIPNIETPYQLLSGDVYVGQWADGKPYGIGKIYYVDLQVYEGQVVDGIPDGEGRKIFKDGSRYTGFVVQQIVGQFKVGEITGRGKFVQSNDGFKYEGEFLSGRPDGIGIESWPDETTYQGSYKLGKKHGRGTFTWGNRKSKKTGKQETYLGEFQNDLFHGQGRYEWADGRIYDGEWVEGKMEGKGEFIWPDKRKYVGEYLKDFKSGYGVLEWPDGKKLSGKWRMGKLQGIATLTIKGKIKEGEKEPEPDKVFLSEWEDGKRIRWLDNQQPSGIHSNVSFQKNFDEHQLQNNVSQILPSQLKSEEISSKIKQSEIVAQQQQKTIFQNNQQKQTQEDSQNILQQQQQNQQQIQQVNEKKNEEENTIRFNDSGNNVNQVVNQEDNQFKSNELKSQPLNDEQQKIKENIPEEDPSLLRFLQS